MTEETTNPLDDKVLTLPFTVTEINVLLNLLGTLPYIQSAGWINNIHTKCAEQLGDQNES